MKQISGKKNTHIHGVEQKAVSHWYNRWCNAPFGCSDILFTV